MTVTKTQCFRLIVSMSCGCKVQQEFKSSTCSEALDDIELKLCPKHPKNIPGTDILEMVLTERLEEEIKRSQPAVRATTQEGKGVRSTEDQPTPINPAASSRIAIRRAGTTDRPKPGLPVPQVTH